MNNIELLDQLEAQHQIKLERIRQHTLEVYLPDRKNHKKAKRKVIHYGELVVDIEDVGRIGYEDLYYANLEEVRLGKPPQQMKWGYLGDIHSVAKAVFPYLIEKYQGHYERLENLMSQSPFSICYNPMAEVWIIEGSLPHFMMGGVDTIIVSKQTGELIAMYGSR